MTSTMRGRNLVKLKKLRAGSYVTAWVHESEVAGRLAAGWERA